MDELKKLLERMRSCRADMDSYLGKAKQAESEEDRTKFRQLFEAKSEEFATLKSEYDERKSLAEMDGVLAEAQTLVNTSSKSEGANGMNAAQGKSEEGEQTRGKTNGPRVGDGFTDPYQKEAERVQHFLQYCAKGASGLSDRQRDTIAATDPRAIKAEGEVMMPKSLVARIANQGRYGKSVFAPDSPLGKAMLTTDATGGVTDSNLAETIAPDFRPTLLQEPVYAPRIYDFVRLIPAVNGVAEWPVLDQDQGAYGGVAFTWKATEGGDKGETEPVFKDFSINTHELSGWTETSLRALRRPAISLENLIVELFGNAARHEWSRVILFGAGDASNQPMGIVNASGVVAINRAIAAQVAWADLTELEYGIVKDFRTGARYLTIDAVEKYLKQQVDSDDRPIFSSDTGSNLRNLLAGYAYQTHTYQNNGATMALGIKGDTIYGNPQNYGFAMEEDISIARSEHAEFKKGRVVFRMICWVGGKPIYPSAFSVLDVPSGS